MAVRFQAVLSGIEDGSRRTSLAFPTTSQGRVLASDVSTTLTVVVMTGERSMTVFNESDNVLHISAAGEVGILLGAFSASVIACIEGQTYELSSTGASAQTKVVMC